MSIALRKPAFRAAPLPPFFVSVTNVIPLKPLRILAVASVLPSFTTITSSHSASVSSTTRPMVPPLLYVGITTQIPLFRSTSFCRFWSIVDIYWLQTNLRDRTIGLTADVDTAWCQRLSLTAVERVIGRLACRRLDAADACAAALLTDDIRGHVLHVTT